MRKAKSFRLSGWLRHPCRAHEDRDDRNGVAQRGLDLKANEVGLVIYSFAATSAGTEPALADNDQQDIAPEDCFTYLDAKVLAIRNVVDVHEDRRLAVTCGEAIANTARHHIGIGATVRDRDLGTGLGKMVGADGTTPATKALDFGGSAAMRSFELTAQRRSRVGILRSGKGAVSFVSMPAYRGVIASAVYTRIDISGWRRHLHAQVH